MVFLFFYREENYGSWTNLKALQIELHMFINTAQTSQQALDRREMLISSKEKFAHAEV